MALNGQDAGFDMPEDFDPSKEANSTEMVGLGIAHLATDANEAERNGTVVTLAELADMYGFTDLDGRPSMRHQYVD